MKIEDLKKEYSHLIPENFYFECGDGWYNILNCLLRGISWAISNDYYRDKKMPYNEQVPINAPEYNFQIRQVKEKFGTLRFYYSVDKLREEIRGMVTMAELLSECTCEYTGAPGKRYNNNGWLKTMNEVKAAKLGLIK